ncbi:hypothetical protein DEFDS_0820 [Deferribacter desulfuricans SSM1]|uniref:Uncharacterized protein n=1 Tax=Deferribacter desulfuricans (strain DSM 14783 / JCM 11476 / NBRC 101012 / SSM1) TaxID=639282 RepID=D3PCH3_DEFDS|nr:hypothetical protein [Deferribacter desulfuricans]BAI80296.1 hypothetical protein DEFDS_0820 [Deferribacter desulfuricans SSM1]
MKKLEIVEGLEEHYQKINKKYNKGSSFNPFKYYKYVDGKNVPVFFIGTPGLAVAVSATLVAGLLFYLIQFPFKLYIWIPFGIFVAFIMRLAVKIDKARQIRSFSSHLVLRGLNFLKEFNKSQNSDYLNEAVKILEEANKWVDDPRLQKQIEIARSFDIIEK